MSAHRHSIEFCNEVLGGFQRCPRANCRGTLILVFSRYEDHGPLNKEYECTSCGKVKKDPLLAEERRRQYEARKEQRRQREARKQQQAQEKR